MSNGKDFTIHILGWDSAMPTQGNISSSQVIKYGKKLLWWIVQKVRKTR